MLTQEASSIDTCTPRLAMKNAPPQILGCADFAIVSNPDTHVPHQTHHNSSGFSDGSLFDSVDTGKFFPCGEQQREGCETTHVFDDNSSVKVHVEDVNACSSQMDKLSVNASKAQVFLEGQGELSPTIKGIQSVSPQVSNGSNDDVLNVSNEKGSEGQSLITSPLCKPAADDVLNVSNEKGSEDQTSPPRKPAAWRTPESKVGVVPESEFIMEASSWPTLAEARHAKLSEARLSPSHKETTSVSLPAEKENSIEAPKHSNTNPPQSGSKYRSSYKKGSVPSYGKPSFPASENVPMPPVGVHVPSANMFNLDQSRKGNGIGGMNNFFPGPHQAPANGPFYQQRGEGLAPFPHNSVPPYGRGHPGWQHHGRGYSDANYKHSGFIPMHDQQHIDPRHGHPPMAPFMNINIAQYNYPNIPVGDVSYMPAAFSPGYNYATPYFRPSGPPAGIMQGPDFPTLLGMLQRQIEYYFSKENLIHDIFLTSKMDEEGFVPVSLIASFPRVRYLTSNSMHILEALKNSSIVEVKNGKLRSHEWRRQLSGSSQTHGIESLESFAPLSNTGMDHAREQGTGESEEFGKGGFDKMSTLPESTSIAGSCAAPWTGLSGLSTKLGAVNVPAATSIDSR